jgi:hypothetical protein
MAGYLPEMQHLDVRPAIGAYELGQNRGNEDVQQSLLRRVGNTAATQGLDAASREAMSGGDIKTGVGLSNLSIERQAKLYDFLGRAAVAADTPEKWAQLNGTLAKTFGPESVKGFEDFKSRESAIMLSMSAAQQAQLKLQQEASGRAERALKLSERAATEKPTYQTVEDSSGVKRIVEIKPGGGARAIPVEGMDTQTTNPFSNGKMNEAQSKDGLYASRMINAETVIRDPAVTAAATSSGDRFTAAAAEKVPFGLARGQISKEFQKFDQAKRDFINATLRRESGAVISKEEFENADKQYFPLPGDDKELLEQKRLNREEAIRGIAAGAGPSWRPPDTVKALGMDRRDRSSKPTLKAMPDAVMKEAKAAIAANKPRDAIIQRLRENGYDPAGL